MTNKEIKEKAINAYIANENKSAQAINYFSVNLPEASYRPNGDRFILAGDSFCYKDLGNKFVLYNPVESYGYIYDLISFGKYLLARKDAIEINRQNKQDVKWSFLYMR